MRGYVLCSWYNHWTLIIIEDVFPGPSECIASGWASEEDRLCPFRVPFDLKVTYLPEGFVKDERKADCLKPELTLLKTAARACDIRFNRAMKSDAQS